MDKTHRKIFEISWNDDLSEGWMNVYNLELCLFSKEHTRRELVEVKEIKTPCEHNGYTIRNVCTYCGKHLNKEESDRCCSGGG